MLTIILAEELDRFHHETLAALQIQSARYVAAARQLGAMRQKTAPARRAFPANCNPTLAQLLAWSPTGQIIYIRRTDEHGQANVLGHGFAVSDRWLRRLVRCEVDLSQEVIRFYGLRRNDSEQQPLLQEVVYRLPARGLSE